MIKVCLVDDHQMMRKGLKQLIQGSKDIRVVDEVSNAEEFLALLKNKLWDVVILDISLPDKNGLHILKDIRAKTKNMPVLVLTMYDEDQYGIRILKAGANGYMTKDSDPEDLLNAIRKVNAGSRHISPKLTELLADNLQKTSSANHESLSDREFEVFKLIGQGKTLSEIGHKFNLSIKTISTYRTRILSKMGFDNNADIIRYCIKNQIEA